jgi:hypothetical protein
MSRNAPRCVIHLLIAGTRINTLRSHPAARRGGAAATGSLGAGRDRCVTVSDCCRGWPCGSTRLGSACASSSRSSDRWSSPTSGCSMTRRTRTPPRFRREFPAEPIGLLLVLVAALAFTGEVGFRRRDIVSSAQRDGIQPTGAPDPLTSCGRQGLVPLWERYLRRRPDARASEDGGAMPAVGRSIGVRHAERVWHRRRVGVVARAERVPRHGGC